MVDTLIISAADVARLASWEGRRPAETAPEYGARVLCFLLAYGITAPLSDDDLEAARHCTIYAVASPDIEPAALANIDRAQMLIASTLRRRAHVAGEVDAALAAASSSSGPAAPGAGRDRRPGDGGVRDPRPIVPSGPGAPDHLPTPRPAADPVASFRHQIERDRLAAAVAVAVGPKHAGRF